MFKTVTKWNIQYSTSLIHWKPYRTSFNVNARQLRVAAYERSARSALIPLNFLGSKVNRAYFATGGSKNGSGTNIKSFTNLDDESDLLDAPIRLPKVEEAFSMPRKFRHCDNKTVFTLAILGEHGARRER